MSVIVKSAPQLQYQNGGWIPAHELWSVSVADYHAMIDAGILTTEDHVELLEGRIVTKMPKSPRHRVVNVLLLQVMTSLLAGMEFHVNSQEPITTLDSEPEPDISVVKGTPFSYLERHPNPDEVELVIEVAHTTLHRDQHAKKRLYASVGIANYWIMNLPDNHVEVYSKPNASLSEPDYFQKQTYRSGDVVPVVIDGVEIGRIPVTDILP